MDANWELVSDIIYSRDVSGREIAIYDNPDLLQWNIYGMDNIGKAQGAYWIIFLMDIIQELTSLEKLQEALINTPTTRTVICQEMILTIIEI